MIWSTSTNQVFAAEKRKTGDTFFGFCPFSSHYKNKPTFWKKMVWRSARGLRSDTFGIQFHSRHFFYSFDSMTSPTLFFSIVFLFFISPDFDFHSDLFQLEYVKLWLCFIVLFVWFFLNDQKDHRWRHFGVERLVPHSYLITPTLLFHSSFEELVFCLFRPFLRMVSCFFLCSLHCNWWWLFGLIYGVKLGKNDRSRSTSTIQWTLMKTVV